MPLVAQLLRLEEFDALPSWAVASRVIVAFCSVFATQEKDDGVDIYETKLGNSKWGNGVGSSPLCKNEAHAATMLPTLS